MRPFMLSKFCSTGTLYFSCLTQMTISNFCSLKNGQIFWKKLETWPSEIISGNFMSFSFVKCYEMFTFKTIECYTTRRRMRHQSKKGKVKQRITRRLKVILVSKYSRFLVSGCNYLRNGKHVWDIYGTSNSHVCFFCMIFAKLKSILVGIKLLKISSFKHCRYMLTVLLPTA